MTRPSCQPQEEQPWLLEPFLRVRSCCVLSHIQDMMCDCCHLSVPPNHQHSGFLRSLGVCTSDSRHEQGLCTSASVPENYSSWGEWETQAGSPDFPRLSQYSCLQNMQLSQAPVGGDGSAGCPCLTQGHSSHLPCVPVLISLSSGMPNHSASIQVCLWEDGLRRSTELRLMGGQAWWWSSPSSFFSNS